MQVKNDYREIWSDNPMDRQLRDAGAEANRVAQMAIADLKMSPVRTNANVYAKFGELILADCTTETIHVSLPSATQNDIGRTVTVKVWSGYPAGNVIIHAALDGRIDGNTSWTLNQAMKCVCIAYGGNNDWCLIAETLGTGLVVTPV